MRRYSLAYLTASALSASAMVRLAAELGYAEVGLRLQPNAAGAPFQSWLDDPAEQRETLAALHDTGVGVFDLEIVRIGADFDPQQHRRLFEAGALLQAKAVLVAGDDGDLPRLADGYARLCELAQPYGLSCDLEFMPWTAVPDARTALQVVDAAGRPRAAGILVDALHAGRSRTTLADLQALPPQLLHYAQVCDAPGLPEPTVPQLIHTARCERLLPDEGVIDLRGIFASLPAELPLSVEIPHDVRVARVGTREWARAALAACRAVLG
ncbi:MAG: sugar phosphate isomerase/epimerase [Curvibacter sp.]|nr:sugar phosphate isomerase/epimerase [Curvibacter sp.]